MMTTTNNAAQVNRACLQTEQLVTAGASHTNVSRLTPGGACFGYEAGYVQLRSAPNPAGNLQAGRSVEPQGATTFRGLKKRIVGEFPCLRFSGIGRARSMRI